MKGAGRFGYKAFSVSMWYPNSDISKAANGKWISAFASHHTKLLVLEQEVEHCEYLLEQAIKSEAYDEADGLRARVERMRETHPIWSVEQLLSDAIAAHDYAGAQRHLLRLEDIRWNLGLPKFLVGQVVLNTQADIRATIVSCDMGYQMRPEWLRKALEANALKLEKGVEQPFYTLLVDERDDELTPRELYVEQQNVYSQQSRPAVYLPEEALELCHNLEAGFQHGLAEFLFESTTPEPAPDGMVVGLGLRLKPTIRLRMWQRQQHERLGSYGSSI